MYPNKTELTVVLISETDLIQIRMIRNRTTNHGRISRCQVKCDNQLMRWKIFLTAILDRTYYPSEKVQSLVDDQIAFPNRYEVISVINTFKYSRVIYLILYYFHRIIVLFLII